MCQNNWQCTAFISNFLTALSVNLDCCFGSRFILSTFTYNWLYNFFLNFLIIK